MTGEVRLREHQESGDPAFARKLVEMRVTLNSGETLTRLFAMRGAL